MYYEAWSFTPWSRLFNLETQRNLIYHQSKHTANFTLSQLLQFILFILRDMQIWFVSLNIFALYVCYLLRAVFSSYLVCSVLEHIQLGCDVFLASQFQGKWYKPSFLKQFQKVIHTYHCFFFFISKDRGDLDKFLSIPSSNFNMNKLLYVALTVHTAACSFGATLSGCFSIKLSCFLPAYSTLMITVSMFQRKLNILIQSGSLCDQFVTYLRITLRWDLCINWCVALLFIFLRLFFKQNTKWVKMWWNVLFKKSRQKWRIFLPSNCSRMKRYLHGYRLGFVFFLWGRKSS